MSTTQRPIECCLPMAVLAAEWALPQAASQAVATRAAASVFNNQVGLEGDGLLHVESTWCLGTEAAWGPVLC